MSAPRPMSAGGGGGGVGSATIDPIRLLKKYKWLLGASVIAGAALGVASHLALLRVYPIFTPTVLFQIEPPRDRFGQLPESRDFNEEELKRTMQTEAATMTSDRVLQRVCDRLNRAPTLAPNWRRQFEENGQFQVQDAVVELEKIVSAGPVANTWLVQLSASYTDPTDATALAELMRREYLAMRQADEQGVLSENKRQLDAQLQGQNDRIAGLQRDRDAAISGVGEAGTVTEALQSIDGRYNEAAQTQQIVSAQLQEARQQLEILRVNQAQLQAAKEAPGGINYPDTVRAIVEANPIVAQARQFIDAIQTEIRVLQERRVGESHPEMRNLRDRLRAAEQNLTDVRERELLTTFNAQLDQVQTGIASLTGAVDSLEAQRDDLARRLQDLLTSSRKINDMEIQISRLIESRNETQTDLENLEAFIRQATTNPEAGVGRVRVVQRERKPDEPSFPKLRLMVPAGVVLVVGLVGGVIFLREVLDQRVKSPQDIGLIPRTRVLGIVPHAGEDPTSPKKVETAFRDNAKGVIAEYFRQIRSPLVKRMEQTGAKAVLFAGGMPGSGATSIVSNMGYAMAALEKRTLVIDANLRRPAMHKVFGVPEGPGLAEVLAGKASLDEVVHQTSTPNLSVLSVGGAEDRVYERLATPAMTRLLAEAREKYDAILLDVAPAMVAGDAVALAGQTDASILVVRAMGEKRGLVARLRNELTEARSEFLGVLVNAVRSAAGGYIRKNIKETHGYQAAKS
ncbi:MAG: polysaccharide biosynthesis tyrosine autokinase [Phycisphaerales bacterium]